MIKAEIVADSLDPRGNRLTSVLCTFPRIILAEVNTHRMLSKNTSSSRAIPFNKMVEAVESNPFIPIAWQRTHKGMQGNEYWGKEDWLVDQPNVSQINVHNCAIGNWLQARDNAVSLAKQLNNKNITKQLCNRLLEPFMWTTMLITGSKEGWENFFELRCPQYLQQGKTYKSKKEAINIAHSKLSDKRGLPTTDLEWLRVNKGQAEIHIMDLAEKIYDVMNESRPKQLEAGEWHIPFWDKIDMGHVAGTEGFDYANAVRISTAMAARTSYTVVGDEKAIDYSRMIELHDRLLSQDPPHSSPMEHCARAMSDNEHWGCYSKQNGANNVESGWCRNFRGFIQYRHIIENGKR